MSEAGPGWSVTASRVVSAASGGYTVGVLVQANHGRRPCLRINGVPVGEAIPSSEISALDCLANDAV
jgi:D-aminopeptidase